MNIEKNLTQEQSEKLRKKFEEFGIFKEPKDRNSNDYMKVIFRTIDLSTVFEKHWDV
jgi:hypothetical protein